MRAILVTDADCNLFQSRLQQELDGITAARGTVQDVKFSTACDDESTRWSALILAIEPHEAGLDLSVAEAGVSEAIPPDELIEVIVPPREGV